MRSAPRRMRAGIWMAATRGIAQPSAWTSRTGGGMCCALTACTWNRRCANFDVHKDKKHPFIVKTSLLSVRALGTKFNIQAYSEDRKTITTLENGKVQINNLLAPDSCFILTPGEQLEYNHLTKNYEKRKIDVMMASGWTRGELNFVDCHLEDILNTLGRHYNVEIKAEPHLYTNEIGRAHV